MKYSLASRELIADSCESMAMAHGFDGMVFIPNCDKIVPGMLMAARRLNLPAMVISGGPMMGMAMYDLNTPITKTSSSILAMSEDEVEKFEPTNCIRCGRCATVCPSHLVPQMMAQAAERNDLDYFQKLNGMECYECGTCTFVCPAKRRLTQIFKQARRAVMDQNRKK